MGESLCFEQACTVFARLRESGGGVAPPPIFKHNARMMGLYALKQACSASKASLQGFQKRGLPHTCKHDGVWKGFISVEASLYGLNEWGLGGPPFPSPCIFKHKALAHCERRRQNEMRNADLPGRKCWTWDRVE